MLAENNDRKVVPRWRDFNTTVAIGELSDPTKQPHFTLQADSLVAQRYNEWSASKTIWHAADLLSSALVAGSVRDGMDRSGSWDSSKAFCKLTDTRLMTRSAGREWYMPLVGLMLEDSFSRRCS